MGVRAWDDLPVEPATDPLRFASPGALLSLAREIDAGAAPGIEPLRDATCQSFPVWVFRSAHAGALGAASDEALERLAEGWHRALSPEDSDALDLYELSTCLGELREALRQADPAQLLCVLLEEKAL